ncbi:MAG: hypothetical protein E7277_06105 [Lachnospiraceae bacterium]|nr:hypothetical protein [Lachnospiraceae bacterium]
MAICRICGWNSQEDLLLGDICECCGNEYGFDDDMSVRTLLEDYLDGNREALCQMVPEIASYTMEDTVPEDVAWRFLRIKWVKNGCISDLSVKPDYQEQLKQIGYDLDALKKFKLPEFP